MAKKIKESSSVNIKLITKDNFSKEVEQFISETKSDILSAITLVADKKKIEMESIPKFLSASLKLKLEEEMVKLRMLKKKNKVSNDARKNTRDVAVHENALDQ